MHTETSNKLADINPTSTGITFPVYGLNNTIKRQRLANGLTFQLYVIFKRCALVLKIQIG